MRHIVFGLLIFCVGLTYATPNVSVYFKQTSIGMAQPDVDIYYEHTADGYTSYANNNEDHTIYIEFEFSLNNLKVIREGPSSIEIPANSVKHKLLDLVILNKLKSYSFQHTYELNLERDYDEIFESETIQDALAIQDSISKIEEQAIVDADEVEERLKAIDTILVTEVPAVKIQKIEIDVQPPIEEVIQEPVNTPEPVVKEEIEVVEKELTQKPVDVVTPPVVAALEIKEAEDIPEPTIEVVEEEPLPIPDPVPVVVAEDIAIEEPIIEKENAPRKEIKRRFETTTKYKAAFKYQLPFMKGSEFRISQGYNGVRSHQGQFALDFDMPIGTQVHAVREGIVSEIVQSNGRGCATQDCEKYDNYILIHHEDGSWAKYAHLKEQSAAVSEGDMIGEGQFLGYSGNTGWTASPSLHFEILREVDDELKTVKTNFLTGDGSEYGLLMEGMYYKRDY